MKLRTKRNLTFYRMIYNAFCPSSLSRKMSQGRRFPETAWRWLLDDWREEECPWRLMMI